ncbi:hypothetical protein CEQ90_06105 [Lewinellaceae bacterium SD302]|nr:hypothetical protein CEQ90_06105 [Lewinellaceae bacterium SD302]
MFLTLLFSFQACVFEDFDEPPVRNLSDLEGNTTIADLKDLHVLGSGTATPIADEDAVLEATVVGNDISGAIFKELILQDGTGGIIVRLDEVGLNALFPVGAKIVMPLAGLFVNDFGDKYQITSAEGERIPAALVPSTVFVTESAEPIEPRLFTIQDFANDDTLERYLSTLVMFDSLQFQGNDAGAPFADVINGESLNRTLENCDGFTLVTRTSSFADFAGLNTPTGRGRVVGLLDVFIDTRQIRLRSLDDLDMEGERCGAVTGNNLISIEDLRAQYTGDVTSISDDTRIRGVVISDFEAGNQQGQNLVLQDGGSGIVIRFDSEHSFPLGTDLELAVSGQELSEFRGILQVNNLSQANATSNGIIPLPSARQATVAEILDNAESWESTLVEIDPATVSGGPTFGDNVNVTDDSGESIQIFSLFSVFAEESVPTGEGSVTAILSQFEDDYQLQINDPSDIDVEGGMTGEEEEITAGELRDLFASGTTFVPADRFIEGIVISDVAATNINNRNLIVQTGESGIVIRLDEAYSFPQNTRIKLSIGGNEISEFSSVLQVAGTLSEIEDLGIDDAPEARDVTIAEVIANGEEWESTLVRIEGLSFVDVTTFPVDFETINMTDGDDILPAFIRGGQASFSGFPVPNGPFTATVVVTEFEGAFQAYVRNLDDFE